jgi:FG-GAP repeat protein
VNHRRRLVVIPTIGGLAATACLMLAPPASAAATGCNVTSSASDYNGDGYDDVAIGDPYATVNGQKQAGKVTVMLGDADGRIGDGDRVTITQADFGDTAEAGDRFGFDVALSRARSGCASLLVGSPGEDLNGVADAGIAYLINDLPDLEGTPFADVFALTQADAKGAVEAGDQFGSTVAITGLNQEDRHRLVIGAPAEDAGTIADAGAVSVFEVNDDVQGLGELRQGARSPLGAVRLPDTPEPGDRFGAALATGLVDVAERSGQEIAQGLVIGAPGDMVSGRDGAGSVTVLSEKFESASLISQDSAGVPGAAENGDQFGYSVALSPQVGSRAATLAVGSPGENAGTVVDTGSVTLFNNTGERFVSRGSFSQATPGVPGTNEAGDRFGYSLVFAQRAGRLFVGSPTEDVGMEADAGTVQPVRIPGASSPLQFPPTITEGDPGMGETVDTDHQFGRTLGALNGRSENILTISSPFTDTGAIPNPTTDTGVVYVLSDDTNVAPRSWLPQDGAGRFGWAVSN